MVSAYPERKHTDDQIAECSWIHKETFLMTPSVLTIDILCHRGLYIPTLNGNKKHPDSEQQSGSHKV